LRELREGCAVCRLVNSIGRRYVESILYELVNDPGVQAEFRESLGFCSRHDYLMVGDGLGTAILYRAATRELLETLSRIPDAPKPRTSLRPPRTPVRGRAGRPRTRERLHGLPL
jgi:hypothetical protein